MEDLGHGFSWCQNPIPPIGESTSDDSDKEDKEDKEGEIHPEISATILP